MGWPDFLKFLLVSPCLRLNSYISRTLGVGEVNFLIEKNNGTKQEWQQIKAPFRLGQLSQFVTNHFGVFWFFKPLLGRTFHTIHINTILQYKKWFVNFIHSYCSAGSRCHCLSIWSGRISFPLFIFLLLLLYQDFNAMLRVP